MITVTNLTKRFRGLTAVDNLTFTVKPGQAVALWGANGAGKTTALRCLLHLIPFEGKVTLADVDVKKEGKAARRLIGFVPQELTFHDDLTVMETLTFYARLKKVEAGYDFTPLLTQLQLVEHLRKPIHDLSGGLKQRLALALALLNDPPILILDEPTANLDIRAREEFLALVNKLKESGKTLVFSSHRLEEVMALADRVLLLEAGKLVIDAPPYELEARLGWESSLYLYMPAHRMARAVNALNEIGILASPNGRGLRVPVKADQKAQVMHTLMAAGVEIEDFAIE
ncbi:MAG: ABC transporter ATP-binding protein [Ardenticatenaceae bacterium]|nr:ABC transporter ATP-binding protein [Ardenticatenaceae bacterium]